MIRPNTRTQWLAALAKLTSPMHSADTALAFNAYVPLLTALPDAAFTADSLEYVAARCTHGVPTYATMREHLTTHWRENRPNHLRLNAPDTLPTQRTTPTTDELESVASIVKRGVADIETHYDATYAPRSKNAEAPTAKYLTRTQLNAEYARLGAKGPNVTP